MPNPKGEAFVYISLRNQGVYHTCTNCNVGKNIDGDVRKVITEQQAQTKGLKKCARCIVLKERSLCGKVESAA